MEMISAPGLTRIIINRLPCDLSLPRCFGYALVLLPGFSPLPAKQRGHHYYSVVQKS